MIDDEANLIAAERERESEREMGAKRALKAGICACEIVGTCVIVRGGQCSTYQARVQYF
jgi:hypothetical protein